MFCPEFPDHYQIRADRRERKSTRSTTLNGYERPPEAVALQLARDAKNAPQDGIIAYEETAH